MSETRNAADPRQVRRMSQEEKATRKQELEDVKWILSTRQGRRHYWRMLRETHMFETSFTGNNTTFFNEGERNVGLKMMNDLMAAEPSAYLQMVREAQDEEHGDGSS